MTKFQIFIFAIILVVAVMFRFGQLGDISTGLHADEASQAYNAYSLLKTGKDMYGKSFPVLFRANGSYQPPVYTYLTTIPVFLFGNTVFSARFISALAGSGLVVVSFLLVYLFGLGKKQERIKQALFTSLVLAISPWAVHFSRLAVEGNLVIVFFVLGLLLISFSLKRKWFFVLACLVFGFTTHIYYTERITSLLFLLLFVFLFKKYFLERRKEIIIGLAVLAFVLIPHLIIARSGALTNRLSQVGYVNDVKAKEGSIISRARFIIGQFADHYISYYSPKNLFFDPGQSLGRTSSDLSVFYPWFFIFALVGIRYLVQYRQKLITKLLVLVLILGPMPAGITGDLFYPLRVLTFLWAVTFIVSYGFYYSWNWFEYKRLRPIIFFSIFFYSAFYFYVSYFATSKYATSPDLGYSYIKLIDELPKYSDKKILVDFSPRSWGAGIRLAYLLKADPKKIQENLASQLGTPYYGGSVNAWETFQINNITIKPLNWLEVCGNNVIVVGDRYSVSEAQIADHKMKLEFAVKNTVNENVLFGYSVSKKCDSRRLN